MANDINTKVWDLDTVGVISRSQVIIDKISVTWTSTVGTIKQLIISALEEPTASAPGAEIVSITELSSIPTSGNLTRVYDIGGTYPSLHLTTFTSIDKLLVYTK